MRRVLARIRLFEIRWLYRTIAILELTLKRKADQLAAAKLRREFTAQTIDIINSGQRRFGWTRQQRRRFKRELVRNR